MILAEFAYSVYNVSEEAQKNRNMPTFKREMIKEYVMLKKYFGGLSLFDTCGMEKG